MKLRSQISTAQQDAEIWHYSVFWVYSIFLIILISNPLNVSLVNYSRYATLFIVLPQVQSWPQYTNYFNAYIRDNILYVFYLQFTWHYNDKDLDCNKSITK
jgi:hypothetical protein